MKRHVIILCAVIGAVIGATFPGAPAFASGSSAPPARYDHPHPDMLIVDRFTANEVHRICAGAGAVMRAGGRIVACAPVGVARCIIIAPRSHPQKAALIRHERAHCNGWPANHPR